MLCVLSVGFEFSRLVFLFVGNDGSTFSWLCVVYVACVGLILYLSVMFEVFVRFDLFVGIYIVVWLCLCFRVFVNLLLVRMNTWLYCFRRWFAVY